MNSQEEFSFRFHDGSRKDNQIVRQLELACPQGTDVQMVYAAEEPRAAKFGKDFVILLGQSKETGETKGIIMATWRYVQMEPGNFIKVSWMFGLRIHPKARRSGLATQLVTEIEKWMVENEIKFVYCGIGHDNYPSMKLFDKLGYFTIFQCPWYNINIESAYRRILIEKNVNDGIKARKLNPFESGAFIRRHFGDRFFFPDWDKNPLQSDIIEASNENGDSVAFIIGRKAEGFVFTKVPFRVRVSIWALRILSWFFPSYFETPLTFDQAWRTLFIFPFLFRCKSENEQPRLLKAAIRRAITEYHGNTDIFVTTLDQCVSGMDWSSDPKLFNQIRSSLYESSIYKDTGGAFFGKFIGISDPERVQQLTRFVQNQSHIFIDGNEI